MSTVTRVLLGDILSYRNEKVVSFDLPFFKNWYENVRSGECYKGSAEVQEQGVKDDIEVISGRIAISL